MLLYGKGFVSGELNKSARKRGARRNEEAEK